MFWDSFGRFCYQVNAAATAECMTPCLIMLLPKAWRIRSQLQEHQAVASVSPVLHPKSFESKENTEKKEQYMPLSQAAAIFYVMYLYMHSSTLLDVPCTMIGLWHSCHKDLFARGNLGVSVGCSPPAPWSGDIQSPSVARTCKEKGAKGVKIHHKHAKDPKPIKID